MASFKHAHMIIATDFELEPVIAQYLETYPEAQPRHYEIAWRTQNESVEGDYVYIVIWKHITSSHRPSLVDFIKAYCELNDNVANIHPKGNVLPSIMSPTVGNPKKYQKK